MATNWADPTLSSTIHIRALHINELRSVVNQNRHAVGLSVFAYQDSPVVSSTTHVRSVHFTDLRQAIQDLWTRQGMGNLPNWSVGSAPSASRQVSARDTTDLRNWIQQYQNATGISYQPIDPVVGPFRGIHLPHGADLRTVDLTALSNFAPGAAVALMNDVYAYTQDHTQSTNLFNWLVTNQNSVEIFLRYFKCPVVPQNTPGYQNYPNISSSAKYISATAAAAEITTQVNAIRLGGLTNFRVIVGNEPEIEWDMNGSAQWFTSFWNDVNNYFIAVYDAFAQGNTQELYPPAFLQGAFVAVSGMNKSGAVTRQAQSPTGPKAFTGADTDYGAFYVQNLIDHYLNFTSVGRLAVHSYFWPGYQANQVIDVFLPGFIRNRVANGMPARVTEFGWTPDAITGCADPTYCCPANLDTTTTSCDGARTGISAAGDYNDYVKNRSVLGGYNIWLLADPVTNTTPNAVAVDSSGTIRPWFTNLITLYNP